MSSLWPKPSTESWFRIGRLEVTTVVLVCLVTVASWLVWVVYPPMAQALAFLPGPVFRGQLWRVFTWPLADALSFWGVLYLFFFWYFGTELENQIGRRRMAWFLGGVWLSLTVAAGLIGIVAPAAVALGGIGLIEFIVLLVWIAENPRRPLFFGIPAWVFGAVLLGLQVLTLAAARGWASLLSLLLALVFVGLIARRQGLLTELTWLPGGNAARRAPKARTTAADRAAAKQAHRRASDRERLDTLLDKINDHGLQSLSEAERKELVDLRNRLRGDA